MEFKVIFIGFAVHCVLNTVLICKSLVTGDDAAKTELTIVEKEEKMMEALNSDSGEIKSLSLQVDEIRNGSPARISR